MNEFKIGDRVVCRDEYRYGDIDIHGVIERIDDTYSRIYLIDFDDGQGTKAGGQVDISYWFWEQELKSFAEAVEERLSAGNIEMAKFQVDLAKDIMEEDKDVLAALGSVDPKQSQGSKKLGFSHVPITSMCALSPGTKNGADKYGAYNWLELAEGSMSLNTYLDAVQRHLILFRAGQDSASDSGIHHLDHILAGISVVRDAMLFNKVSDDRIKLSEEQIEILEKLINQE